MIEFYATARQQKWNDKETGEPRSKVIFRMDDFTFIPSSRPPEPENQEVDGEDEDNDF